MKLIDTSVALPLLRTSVFVVAALVAGCSADLPVNSVGANSQSTPSFATAQAALSAASVSPDRNQGGFPTWYADAAGTTLEPCLDPLDPHCVVLPLAGVYDIALPQVFPSNYPDEAFYAVADSLTATGLCGNVGSLKLTLALEAAYFGGVPKQGDQMTFGRLRLLGSGFCPLHDYVLRHPYGEVAITTDDRGRVRPKNPAATQDVGCIPTAAVPCDFSLALPSSVIQNGFLRWDPAFAPAADVGYLSGDAATLHQITGGVGGFNAVDITETDGTLLYHNDLFTVSGKVANTLRPNTDVVSVGSVVSGTSANRTVTITNGGVTPESVTSLVVTPANSGWTATSDCAGPVLSAGSCTIAIGFAAGATLGATQAQLAILTSVSTSPVNVALTAKVVVAGTAPSLQLLTVSNAPSANFERVIVGRSRTQLLTLHNQGPGELSLAALALVDQLAGSTDGAKFSLTGNCPLGGILQSGQDCQINQKFSPIEHKVYAANLVANGTWGAVPASAQMPLTGRGGIAHSSALVDGLGIDGFPRWYQDDGDLANPALAGTRVSQCLDVNNPYCVVLGDAGFNPALPVVFPTNYPVEAFYYLADANAMTVQDCGAAGKFTLRFAIEQSFATGAVVAGGQMTFARQRVTITGGLCPSTSYLLKHPYGQTTLNVDATGAITAKGGTVDVGCIPAAGQACDFDLAVETTVSDRYLRWDATAPAAPAGYLGDPAVAHTVTGAPSGLNAVQLTKVSTGATVASTNLFLLAGKLASPGLTVSATGIDFGIVTAVAPGNVATRVLTLTNPGTTSNALGARTIKATTGTGFAIVSTTCGATLAGGASCSITLSLTGTAGNGSRAATLTINSEVPATVVNLLGAVGTTPVLVANPLSLAFGSLNVGVTSGAQTIAISNGGPSLLTSALKVTSPLPNKVTAFGPFSVSVPLACSTAMYGSIGCSISVTFKPTVAGTFTQSVTILSDKGGSKIVTLTGIGVALPTATVTPATLTMKANTKAVVTLANSGTVPVVMGTPTTATTGTGAVYFTVTGNTCPAAGGALLVGGNCKITVTYTRPAGLATTIVHTASMTINSNAGGKAVALTGTN